ncbi:phage recombination protein Bet [Tepidimonas charontis]|uniref:Phage recombination protein Bet n=1 Tax=Tepidimonas charontis TaxID=2267262 RepID=A0A554X8D3_9BURK|nr:phage recombination protein Bet [Tepidimonas charontis]TSE32089.1 phage recombination protein Bet [Tepidimonas charontis]
MSTALATLTQKLAARLDMGDGADLIDTLKVTAFKGQVSDAQMTALMVVANQYGLNPWTKEIYAFPDKNNGIVPVVGVDGWSRIINSHPQFDGMEFEQDDESCTCIIYRKDRSRPIKVTEYKAECKRNTEPWEKWPRRMLRHKAMIQCARLAFGFTGIYDHDEAERLVEAIDAQTGEIVKVKPAQPDRPALEPYPADKFSEFFPKWRALIESGRKTADDIIAMVTSRATLTDAQIKAIRDCAVVDVDTTEVTE